MTTSTDDQCITKVFCYKVCAPGFTFFEIVLDQHWRRRRGLPQKFPGIQESSGGYHLERASFSTPSIPPQHRQTRKYNDNYLVNSTALLRPSRPGFLSIRQRASVLTIDFSFQTHFHLAVGVRGGSGFGRIKVICISDNDGSACTGSENMACIAQFRLLYASVTQKCFTFVWRIHVPATLLHITLASYTRSLHKAPPFVSCNHYIFKSMKDNRKFMAVGHAGLCLRWRQFQLPGS